MEYNIFVVCNRVNCRYNNEHRCTFDSITLGRKGRCTRFRERPK